MRDFRVLPVFFVLFRNIILDIWSVMILFKCSVTGHDVLQSSMAIWLIVSAYFLELRDCGRGWRMRFAGFNGKIMQPNNIYSEKRCTFALP